MLKLNTNQVNSSQSSITPKLSIHNIEDVLLTNVHNIGAEHYGTEILSRLIGISNRCETIYIGQDTIAEDIGCCRKTVNRWMTRLCELGIIEKITRPMTTCIYKINPLFLTRKVRMEIRFLIRSAIFLPITLLTALTGIAQPEIMPYIFS